MWSTGETSSSVKTSSPGTYLVTVTDGNDCQSKASTVIETRPLPVADILIAESSGQFSDDGVICQGDSAILFVRGQDTYQWSTGEKGPQIRVKEAGTYNLTATSSSGCVSTANASVSTMKVVADAGKDVDVCGLQHTLTATSLHGTGRWSIRQGSGLLTFVPDENDPDAIIKTNTYGTYKLIWMVMKENCRASSDVRITFHELPVANAGPDQDLNYAFQTKLEAEVTSPGNGRWSLLSGSGNLSDPRSPVADVFNLAKGKNQFLWTISSDMCSAADTVSVMVNDLFVPNVITPDGDNKNQYFVIRDIEKNGPAELTVFNKWGKTVYRNNNYNNTWDGRSSENALLPDDTYFYVLKMADGKIIRSFLVIKR
jgi:gliding motility-associated-like protein